MTTQDDFHTRCDRLESELDSLLSPEELARIQEAERAVRRGAHLLCPWTTGGCGECLVCRERDRFFGLMAREWFRSHRPGNACGARVKPWRRHASNPAAAAVADEEGCFGIANEQNPIMVARAGARTRCGWRP